MVTVPEPELWEKEGPAWRAILDAAKVVTMQVLANARIAVKEWRELRWDVPDFAASWEIVPEQVEANIHVWVHGQRPDYTVFAEGNKWRDIEGQRRFKHFEGGKVSVRFQFDAAAPELPRLGELLHVLGGIVKQIQEAPLTDGRSHPLTP